MTKKKKTLRAAVLASIFAMAFSATAWGSNYNPNSYNIEDIVHDSATWDGAYFSITSSDNNMFKENANLVGSETPSVVEEEELQSALGSKYNETYVGKVKKVAYGGGTVYLVEHSNGIKVYNFNPFSTDTIEGTVLPPAKYPTTWNMEWDKFTQVYQMDYAATLAGFEAERRVAADNLLHLDDVSSITHRIENNKLITTIYNNAKDANDNVIAIGSAEIDLSELGNAIDTNTVLRDNSATNKENYLNYKGLDINENGVITLSVQDTSGNSVTGTANIGDYVKNNAGDAYYNYQEGNKTTINQEITTLKNGWTVQVQGDEDQKNRITAGEVLNFATSTNENNLTVALKTDDNGNSTVEFDFSEKPTFTTVEATESVMVGDRDKQIKIDGTTGTITVGGNGGIEIKSTTNGDGSRTNEINGLTNKEWDVDNIAQYANSGKAATEAQLKGLYDDVKSDIDVINGDITDMNNDITNIKDNSVTQVKKIDNNTWAVYQKVNGKDDNIIINDTTYEVTKEAEDKLEYNQKNIYHVTNNYGSSVGEAIIDTDTEYTVTIDNNGKSGNQVNIYKVKNSFDSFVGEAIIDTDTVTTMTEGNSNIHIENIGENGNYNYKITLNKDLTNLDSVTSRIITATESVATPTLILGETNARTAITFDNTVNDGRITYVDSNEEVQQIANLNDGKVFAGDSGSAFVKLQDGVNIKGGANVQNLSDKNIGVVAEANEDGSATLNVKLSRDITGLNSVTTTTVNSETINVSKVVNINNKTQITENGININNKVIVEENNVNVGGNKIENVAPGELSPDSQDAVNGSQLFNTNQKLDRLGNRVDKVGAGAAALAALHPLDFDPDDKLSFSAGVGNYGSETATALGAFYRPSEKVMLSAAGTMGNGENMVNLGVTFALDKTNNVSNSRVAMAREIQDLKSHIVKQDAQIAELIALVGQLTGKSIGQSEDSIMFPDVPENHWAYDYIEGLQKRGIVEGYPDGNFGGDRSMTRYEYAAMLYRALEKGFPVDSRLLDEFDAELGRIRVDRIKGLDDDGNKIERVRVNQYEGRDDYGSKLTTVNEAE